MPMVKFTPSPEQREVVAALSAAKMPLEKIAASIINPRTKRAISTKTLGRMFKDQLDAGVGVIVEAYRGLRVALEAKEPWAIKYTLDHVAEFKAKEKDITVPQSVKTEITQITVRGIPSPFANEPAGEPEPPTPRLLTLVPPEPSRAAMQNKFPFDEPPSRPAPRTELDQKPSERVSYTATDQSRIFKTKKQNNSWTV